MTVRARLTIDIVYDGEPSERDIHANLQFAATFLAGNGLLGGTNMEVDEWIANVVVQPVDKQYEDGMYVGDCDRCGEQLEWSDRLGCLKARVDRDRPEVCEACEGPDRHHVCDGPDDHDMDDLLAGRPNPFIWVDQESMGNCVLCCRPLVWSEELQVPVTTSNRIRPPDVCGGRAGGEHDQGHVTESKS